jgi:hypothetical protein
MPLLAASMTAVLLLAGCAASPSGPCGQSAIDLDVTVTQEDMTPSALDGCVDVEVTLRVSSEIDGEFHVHGIGDEVEAELVTGETATLTFTPPTAGQFIIEVHPEEGEEFEAGVLTVNEP